MGKVECPPSGSRVDRRPGKNFSDVLQALVRVRSRVRPVDAGRYGRWPLMLCADRVPKQKGATFGYRCVDPSGVLPIPGTTVSALRPSCPRPIGVCQSSFWPVSCRQPTASAPCIFSPPDHDGPGHPRKSCWASATARHLGWVGRSINRPSQGRFCVPCLARA